MKDKDIEQLINKYLEGETSPEEEQELALELQRPDIPQEWKAIRLMLGELTLGEAEYDTIVAKKSLPFGRFFCGLNLFKIACGLFTVIRNYFELKSGSFVQKYSCSLYRSNVNEYIL